MPPRGQKPTPTALKLLRNNPGRRPLNPDEPKPEIVPLEPPATLTGEALKEWNRRAPGLHRLGLLTELDDAAFVAYCRAWGRYVEAEEKLKTMGEVVKAPSGYPIPNPYRGIANKAFQQCQQLWGEFGMTPSARTRVKTSKGAAAPPASKVDRFMRRVR